MGKDNQAPRHLIPLTLAICAAILSCTLTYPFNNDNALYSYMAELALHGHFPYIGSWDQNFPGIVAVHAVQILVGGHSQLAFHIFDILLQLVGSFLLIRIGTLLYDWRAGALAAILATFYYVQQGLWMAGERDTYVSVMLLAALLLTLRGGKHFWVGVLCGVMFLFRPTYGLYGAIYVALDLWVQAAYTKSGAQELDRAIGWKPTANLALGAFVLPVVLVLCYILLGGLNDLWQATILFNLKIYGGTGASFILWEPVRFYAVSLIALGFGAWYLLKKDSNTLILWAALFAASILSLLLLYRHSVYHYHPAMTLVLLLSAIGWIRIADLLAVRWRFVRPVLPAIIILFFAMQTFRGNTVQHVLLDLARGRIHSLEECYDRYEPSAEFGVRVQTEVGDYLLAHTHRGDTVQMFGPYSYPQYRAGLMTASRFQTLHAITMRSVGDSLQPFQREWRSEYLRDMQRTKPIYFIVCDAPEAFRQYYGGRLGHEILRDDFRELGIWLPENYYPETKIGAFTLYRFRGR